MVKRRNWLIAILAALFVLQTPLCVMACLPGATADDSAATTHHTVPPCHEQAPPSAPAEPSDAHEDCGCGDSYTAVLASAGLTFSNAESAATLLPTTLEVPRNAVFGRTTRARPGEVDLPPPDILLLKSTLLI